MLYIHVPFCKSRCIYCDFYSTTATEDFRKAYVRAAQAEMTMRSGELQGAPLQSIYFGGGTPSQLQPDDIAGLLDTAAAYGWQKDVEITLEANPDDITLDFARSLRSMGINRVSMGVQSFNDKVLNVLRRRHSAQQAHDAVETLLQAGFENISIDLIYGLPVQTAEDWQKDLEKAFSLPITHLSAYALSIEEGTPLDRLMMEGKFKVKDEQTYISEYEQLMDAALKHGFTHYEISNFARKGRESRHNSGYWEERPYVGIGPGACSFDGQRTRRTNLPDLKAYVAGMGQPAHEDERLNDGELFNETVFTALRTRQGLSVPKLQERFPPSWIDELQQAARPHVEAGRLAEKEGGELVLTKNGLFVSNDVMSDLMRV